LAPRLPSSVGMQSIASDGFVQLKGIDPASSLG
jgi:hypothetical protein